MEEDKNRLDKKVTIYIDGIIFETTVEKFENSGPKYAIIDENYYDVERLDDDSDEFSFSPSDGHEDVREFFEKFTDKMIVIKSEYIKYDTCHTIERVSFINCDCPDDQKKYYSNGLFIFDSGTRLEIDSDDYKEINFDEIWEDAEISNRGVECIEYSEYLKQ